MTGPLISPRAPINRAPSEAGAALTRAQKAAIILGVLGSDAAGPLLEQLNEDALRNFAVAMSRLRNVPPETVTAVIGEFLEALPRMEMTVSGGLEHARMMLEEFVNEATLSRIMDDAEVPSVKNVWQKLATVDETVLIDFLSHEHPQTAAVVLSKLSAEKAGQLLGRMNPDFARGVALGLAKASSLDASVVEAIGLSLGRDFLLKQRSGGKSFKPADRIGAIMNFTTGEIRQAVLSYLDEVQPVLAEEVKRKLFTFQDIPKSLERRDVTAVVRATDPDALLKALAGAAETAPETQEFLLSNISSRVAEQLRADLAELGKVRAREAEEAQTAVVKVIRDLESSGALALISEDDE